MHNDIQSALYDADFPPPPFISLESLQKRRIAVDGNGGGKPKDEMYAIRLVGVVSYNFTD